MTSPAWQQIASLKGPKGDPGNTGSAGRGVQAATLNETGQLVITFTDGIVVNLGVVVGPPGADGRSVAIEGSVPTAADLPTLGPGDRGSGYITTDTGNLHVWDGTQFLDVGPVRGPKGDKGDPGPAGQRGTVWFNGDGPPPAVIPGAQLADYYLDKTSGVVWQVT